jgi:hypothetical protein
MRQRIGKNVATATLMLLSSAMVMAQSNTFSCSSDDGKRHTCTANGNSAIQFVRQRSQSPCIQGRTYGIDRGSVWVTNGCRADFAVSNYGYNRPPNNSRGYHGGGGGYVGAGSIKYYGSFENGIATCSARNDQPRTFCSTYGSLRNARPLQVNGNCQLGRSWDVGPNGLWVSSGCSGKWQVIR